MRKQAPLPRPAALVTPSPSQTYNTHSGTLHQQPEPLFVVALLERSTVLIPWGLSLTTVNEKIILSESSTPFLRAAWTAPWNVVMPHGTGPDTGIPGTQFVARSTQAAVRYALHPTSSLAAPRSLSRPSMEPGDVFLGLNGRDIRQVSNLSQVTQYLRGCTQVSLLLLRCRNLQSRLPQSSTPVPRSLFAAPSVCVPRKLPTVTKTIVRRPPSHVVCQGPLNPLFQDSTTGRKIPYCDNSNEYYDPEGRAQLFLDKSCRQDFHGWLRQRKRKWRSQCYRTHPYTQQWVTPEVENDSKEKEHAPSVCDVQQRHESSVDIDFWTHQGYSDFDQWLQTSKGHWKQSYSWNRQKRQKIQQDCKQHVQLDSSNFTEWLRVRKCQWKVLRRKRQRERRAATKEHAVEDAPVHGDNENHASPLVKSPDPPPPTEVLVIDALLEDQEQQRQARERRRNALDIMALFDPQRGCPDDPLAHCLSYLDPLEHGKLLCINKGARKVLMTRDKMWRQLCPEHWVLPRRPRKPWHELYLGLLKRETEQSRKRWDDLLSKASSILFKRDELQSLEKLVRKGEKDFQFDVNYTSGVVCERNSLLNLATIQGRHKVVRWLVEVKGADIETYDRGNFTPLLNAAWAGDRYLVRFLMSKGADRSKIGMFHYTKPLSSPDFKGLTPEGWATEKGFDDIAKLIRLGL